MTKEAMRAHLAALLERLFALDSVERAIIRGMEITRSGGDVAAAVDAGWHDAYSDVDMTVISRESIAPEAIGVTEQSCLGWMVVPESGLLRAVFRGGARYDICFTGGVAAEEDPSPFPVARMNRFWFVLVQALGKLYRRDYLIAAHLANECINETLVQQMVLRDLTAGTTHHRYGGAERLAWEQYAGCCPYLTGEDGFDRIADRLHAAALAFDDLAPQLQADYLPRYDALAAIWHDYAKALVM